MTKIDPHQYHTLLPFWAQQKLRLAASVINSERDPRAREKAIESALREIQLRVPSAFVSESGGENDSGRKKRVQSAGRTVSPLGKMD